MTEPKPSSNDSEWSRLNKARMEYAVARNWPGYRNETLFMAEFLRKEGRLEQALRTYLEVCYIDLNGPQNAGTCADLGIPNFDPEGSFGLAPGIIKRIRIAAKKLSFDEARIEELFVAMASLVRRSMKLPVTPGDAWKAIEPEVFQA